MLICNVYFKHSFSLFCASILAPEPYILFSHGSAISKMDQSGLNFHPVLEDVGDVKAFDYHYTTRSLFWIDGRHKAIAWAPLEGGQSAVSTILCHSR